MGVRRRFVTLVSVLAMAGALVVVGAGASGPASAAVPTGFVEEQVVAGLSAPTAMTFAPDGRIFVAQQGGRLRVVKNGALLTTPFLSVPVDASGERGLLGVALDPAFATNRYVYVYYTTSTAPVHNRVSRFTANGDVAVAGSEVVLLELDNLSTATIHNGGALHFGLDGKLYVAVGDNANSASAQGMNSRFGKMLRINKDGSIPTDNPFFATALGANRAIWALGLRNPFTFAFRPGTSRMFINDVGAQTWEEINDGIAGSNYGWPTSEGPTTDPRFRGPLYAYPHGTGNTAGCAITGGAFYNPSTVTFPAQYVGDYFFADYCNGWIRHYDPADGSVNFFAGIAASPVDVRVGSDGALYYVTRGGVLHRIRYTASGAPVVGAHPASQTVSEGGTASFTVAASGQSPLSYQWQRNGVDIPGATGTTYTKSNVPMSEDGARFRVRVSNGVGSTLSNEAVLTVTTNQPPAASITQPVAGSLYSGGQAVTYAGTATDPEDGSLGGSAFTWRVDFHHADHVHPFLEPRIGSTSGSFTIPRTGHTEADVWYRIHLTVRDSAGLTTSVFRDIRPRTAQVTLATSPTGLELLLDGRPVTTPHTYTGVVGLQHQVEARSPQTRDGRTYEFARWSDGLARQHTVTVPGTATTFTATFRDITTGDGLSARYYDNQNLTGATVDRVDPRVDFNWQSGSPAAGIGADSFSARWVGTVRVPTTGTYTFYTQTDDGARLWVNNKKLVDDWTAHAVTERSGTVSLTAGVRYPIRMEYFDGSSVASARLLWSGPSVPKAVVPTSALFSRFAARINFQPPNTPVPSGYLPDVGSAFGLRYNGERYGWNAPNGQNTFDRNAAGSPDQRFDTGALMQASGNPNAAWQVAVPNGTYVVRVVSGDPSFYNSTFRVAVEGVATVEGQPSSAAPWLDRTRTVTVTDGLLTITNMSGAVNNKIAFVEIS